MRTVIVAVTGVTGSSLLARSARRFAVLDRLRAGGSGGRRLPARLRVPLVRAFDRAAVSQSPEQMAQVWLLAVAVAGLLGAGIGAATSLLAAAAVVIGGPVALYTARHRRARLVAAAVPESLERVGSELRAGGTIATAASVAAGEGALASDVARVEARVRLGAPLADALLEWSREQPAAGVEAAAGALALTSSVGGRAADALDSLASSLRDRLGVIAETRALSAQARYSAWVIGLAPAGYLMCSGVLDPRSVHALVSTAGGRVCAVVGLGLEGLGAVWMRAIIGDRT